MTKVSTTAKSPPAKKKAVAKTTSSSKSRTGPQRILDFALTYETQHKDQSIPRKMVLGAAGVKSNTFTVTLSQMKTKGLIDYDKESIRLTKIGREQATPTDIPVDNSTTQAELKERHKIGGKAGLLFDMLLDGQSHDRVDVQTAIDCTNKGSFSVMICNLKKKTGIIEYDKTSIRMTDLCFPFGRPDA